MLHFVTFPAFCMGQMAAWNGAANGKVSNDMLETQELLVNVLAASNQGVWAIEMDEGSEPRMYADATMRRLLGVEGTVLTPEQVYHAWYDHIHTDHLDEVHRSVEEMIQGLQSEVQYPWQHPTEGEIWVRCSGVRNRTYSKGVRLEGLHRDVTELHHIQKRIDILETQQNRIGAERDRMAELVEQTKAAERSKSLFLASISHDLRTPLNAILGFTELLRTEEDTVNRENYLANITYSGNILLDLINDVLDWTRMDARKLTFSRAPMDVRREVEKILEMLRGKAEVKKLDLLCQVPEMGRLELDRRRFRQVVFNLVGNAIKFTDKGVVAVAVEFDKTSEAEGTLRLEVIDTGIGIADGDKTRLMQPFERVEMDGGIRSGAGLGLSICKRIVEHGGGHIEVVSELGKGSIFRVILPKVKLCAEVVQVPKEAVGGTSDRAGAAYGKLAILIVDDIEINRIVLASLCRRLGARLCTEAADVRQALELMRTTHFDLVFTDMKMPQMNGADFIQYVRLDADLSHTQMILVTADVAAREYYRRIGADGVLIKPITVENLKTILDEVLEMCGPQR